MPDVHKETTSSYAPSEAVVKPTGDAPSAARPPCVEGGTAQQGRKQTTIDAWLARRSLPVAVGAIALGSFAATAAVGLVGLGALWVGWLLGFDVSPPPGFPFDG